MVFLNGLHFALVIYFLSCLSIITMEVAGIKFWGETVEDSEIKLKVVVIFRLITLVRKN